MRSWLFLHRLRLRAVYAPRPALEAASRPAPRRPRRVRRVGSAQPGSIARKGFATVLRPQAPPAG